MKKKSGPPSGSRIGRLLSNLFNFRSWSDWDRMKVFTRYLGNGIKKFFVPQTTTDHESFEAARKRLNLTDNDLLKRQNGLLRVSILMAVIACLLLVYALYLLYHVHIKGGIVGLVVMLIALVLAFRYHFWYFQIKEHQLGCTFREWFRRGLMGDKR